MRDAGLTTSSTLLHRIRQHLRSGVLVEAAAEVPKTGGVRGGLDNSMGLDFGLVDGQSFY
jgi:hypothetical protein